MTWGSDGYVVSDYLHVFDRGLLYKKIMKHVLRCAGVCLTDPRIAGTFHSEDCFEIYGIKVRH